MKWVVFLRAVNVGGANRCQPALIAKQLSKFGVVNIGAVGTFVVRKDVSESTLRAAIAKKLPFKCEIMICPARDIIKLASKDPFSRQPAGPDITRFVNVLAKRIPSPPPLPLSLAFGRRLVDQDHCDRGQICPGAVSPADESDQLSRQNREAARRTSHQPQLEYDRESRENP